MRVIIIFSSLFLLSGCGHANGATCDESLKNLRSIFANASRTGNPNTTEAERAISSTRKSCDVTDIEAGIGIAEGLVLLEDYHGSANALREIKPKNDAEGIQKYFELAHLYIQLGDEKSASETATEMREKYPGSRLTLVIGTEYVCTFKRCATALEGAQFLEEKDPSDLGIRLWLAFAYADRHEFLKASEKFEAFLSADEMWRLDSKLALIGVASFSNAKRKDKAMELYTKFSKLKPPQTEQEMAHHELMKKVAEDETDEIYLFSEWPIE